MAIYIQSARKNQIDDILSLTETRVTEKARLDLIGCFHHATRNHILVATENEKVIGTVRCSRGWLSHRFAITHLAVTPGPAATETERRLVQTAEETMKQRWMTPGKKTVFLIDESKLRDPQSTLGEDLGYRNTARIFGSDEGRLLMKKTMKKRYSG
jgi:hypothetical protein